MNSSLIRIGVPFEEPRALPTINELIEATWSFSSNGDVHAPYLKFRSDGRIAGHEHPDETGWTVRDRSIVLLDERGRASVMFDRGRMIDDGKRVLLGRKLFREQRSYELVETTPPHVGQRPHRPAELIRRRGTPPRRNLVILRANEASLHTAWTVDVDEEDRSWDLCTSFYGAPDNFPVDDFGEYAALQRDERKFQALRSLLISNPDLMNYQFFMFPDDDIAMSWSDVNACFHAMQRWGFELAQPSLHRDGVINYENTRQDTRYHVRFTSMVEVMIPIMSRAALLACLPTFDLTRSGFGIDYAWAKILGGDKRQIGIIDDVAVIHTRATGTSYDMRAAYDEGDALSARYGRTEWFQVNVRGGLVR